MRRLLLAGLVLAAIGCGGSDGPTGPDDNNGDPGSLPVGTFTARIDGATWTASAPLAVVYNGGILAIGGSNPSLTTLGFAVIASAPGTYPIGPNQPTNAILTVGAGGPAWVARSNGGSGSITITSISATGATGTFQFDMVPDGTSGSTGSKAITNGAFNVTY